MKNNSENTHTAGTWFRGGNFGGLCDVQTERETVCHDITEANAEHICKCVNAHDELIAALRKIAECENSDFRLDRSDALGFIKIAKSALQKAGIESLQKSSS